MGQSDLLQALRAPFALVALSALALSVLVYAWARFRISERAVRTRQVALLAMAFCAVVSSMVVYQSIRQAEADRQYRIIHALFIVHASINGTIKTTVYSDPLTFRVSSGQINVGCNDQRNTNAVWSAPDGATDIQTTATWENTDNAKQLSQVVVPSGTTVVATGTIAGLDRSFFGCNGGGHGELVLKGTYRIAKDESQGRQILKTIDDQISKKQPLFIAIPQGKGVIPESFDAAIKDGTRHTTVTIPLRVNEDGQVTLGQQLVTGDIPISVTLDRDHIVLIVP